MTLVKIDVREILFWRKVNKTKGCWLWTAGKFSGTEYGQFRSHEKNVRAHRFSYELRNGPIPAGLVVDHKCRVTLCVRPSHLEAVTSGENISRGHSRRIKDAVRAYKKSRPNAR